jgi:Ca-activated chloride channel family protein
MIMKRRISGKKIKRYMSLAIAGMLMLSACGLKTEVPVDEDITQYSEEEIWDRIHRIGRRYDGLDDSRSSGFSLFGSTNSYSNGGMVMYEAAACEDNSDATFSVATVSGPADPIMIDQPWNTEGYNQINESGFINTGSNRFSTFGADVDTATYSNFRRTVYQQYEWDKEGYAYGGLEPSAVRIEEMINYFQYSYPEATDGEKFSVSQTIVPCPWNEDTLLYRVGVRAEKVDISGGSNIVFLVDTSGSMFWNNGLPLAQKALKTLQESLTENDRVSIVTYAGSASVIAEGLTGDMHDDIRHAINSLEAGGGTNGEGGIIKAYEIAQKYFIEGGNNRVILCTDGDFNLGTSSEAGLIELIEEKKETGVFLSVSDSEQAITRTTRWKPLQTTETATTSTSTALQKQRKHSETSSGQHSIL